MRGFAYLGPAGRTGWIDKDRPHAAGIDAMVRPLMLSPCTSDVHNAEMGFVAPGRILGHEGVAEVVEVGPEVRDFKPGDVVLVSALTPNIRSRMAQKGAPQHWDGLLSGNILSNRADGLMAEYAWVPDADMNLAKIPDGVSMEAAVMATDMMNTGLFGVEQADVQFGDTVAVLGIGPVGLMAVAGAKLRGAGRIIAVGSRPACVETARFYGATDIVNYKDGPVSRQVYALTEKQGADRCVICGGGDESLGEAVALVRPGGTVSNVNYFTTAGDLSFSNPRWGYGMSNKTIRCGMTSGGRVRIEAMMELVRHGRIDPAPLVTHRYEGLLGIEEAFSMMARKPPELIKAIVQL